MAVLDGNIKEHVKFDPKDPEHRRAYALIRYRGQLHPSLRFVLEEGYGSIISMMQDKLANSACPLSLLEGTFTAENEHEFPQRKRVVAMAR
jgi:hypothetical protein